VASDDNPISSLCVRRVAFWFLRCGDLVIRVCVAGVTGWTGRPVAAAVEAASDLELVAGVSRSDPASYSSVAEALDTVDVDVLVDFTHAAVVRGNVLAALERSVSVVVGSSGLSATDYEEIDALARTRHVGVIAAGNFSLTAALLLRSAVAAARYLEAWEVIDYANAGKPDAPSGTAREFAERLDGARPAAVGVPIDEILGAREARGATAPAHRSTRFASPVSSSRRKSSSRRRASGCRSATTPARLRHRMSLAYCLRSGLSRSKSV
jgi:4-hydroxy-tetrahydrodipicolinate reductase